MLKVVKCPAMSKDVVAASETPEMIFSMPPTCLYPEKKFKECNVSCSYNPKTHGYTLVQGTSAILSPESLTKLFSRETADRLGRARNVREIIQIVDSLNLAELDGLDLKTKISELDSLEDLNLDSSSNIDSIVRQAERLLQAQADLRQEAESISVKMKLDYGAPATGFGAAYGGASGIVGYGVACIALSNPVTGLGLLAYTALGAAVGGAVGYFW